MDFNKRYKEGYYDKTNIFHCLGYCWSNDEKNNEPLIPESYKGLLLRLHDYRFNENPSEHAKDFNEKWIDDFLRFLAQEGYSAFAPRSYHPFNLEKYRIKFIKAERRPYRYAGFEKIVKHLKRYVFLLQKHKIIEYNRNPKFIDAKDYVGRKVLTTPYTRREHSLTKDEFELLASTDFRNEKLNTARDMFILAVIGGGFRGEELYNHELEVEKRMGKYVIHIFHSKTSSQNSNPVFGALHEVIERNKGKLPNFLPREEFRASLKEIAQKLNLNRTIISPNTFLYAKEKQTKEVLKDIFSIYFARKTLVTILTAYGINDEKIIEFTAHSNTSTLKHYKAELSLSDKFKIINSLMEQPRR